MYVRNNAVNMKLKKWTKCFWKKAGIRRCNNNISEQDLSNERLLFQFSGSMQTIEFSLFLVFRYSAQCVLWRFRWWFWWEKLRGCGCCGGVQTGRLRKEDKLRWVESGRIWELIFWFIFEGDGFGFRFTKLVLVDSQRS